MPDNDTLQINYKNQINISEDIFKRKPTSKLLWIGFQESHFHLGVSLGMMVKEWALVTNPFFPRHEAPRISAPIAVTSDVKWQDKSYQLR